MKKKLPIIFWLVIAGIAIPRWSASQLFFPTDPRVSGPSTHIFSLSRFARTISRSTSYLKAPPHPWGWAGTAQAGPYLRAPAHPWGWMAVQQPAVPGWMAPMPNLTPSR